MARRVALSRWLFVCVLAVFAVLVVGGATRLTDSGLSIVEWRPVTGALPPRGVREWEQVFALYRASPQFRQVNASMTLDGFRGIFWWEYAHRLAGRVAGLVFALPLVWFWARGRIPRSLAPRLGVIAALGASQGLMGWLMVRSGLVRDPRVSPALLALHLGLAFTLAGLLLRTGLDLREGEAPRTSSALSRAADALAVAVAVTAMSGALVAGNHAGLAYNTFPLMAGRLVPEGLFPLRPWYLGAVLDLTTVQFDHRVCALALVAAATAFWTVARRSAVDTSTRRWCHVVMLSLLAQVTLGVATLLLRVPPVLAGAHQANAMLLFLAALRAGHAARSPRAIVEEAVAA